MIDNVQKRASSESDIDLIVADYFAMLEEELAGRRYVKRRHNEALKALTGHPRGAIEWKHQYISAVMVRLALPWIKGYKPRPVFEDPLVNGVGRYLATRGQTLMEPAVATTTRVLESTGLCIGPAPVPSADDLLETPALARLVRKFDPAARDARNRALGRQGEELVFGYERQRLAAAGREDLARKVEWTSEERGDGAGYDIGSFEADGRERLIEVKTTKGAALTPFFLSENERAFSEERADAFALVRLYRFGDAPGAFELRASLGDRVRLGAAGWRASLS